MADGQKLMSGATPIPRLDDRYELADRTGLSMGGMPLATLHNMIRQGRLFRTDQVSKNGGEWTGLGDLPEFDAVFEEVQPEAFKIDGTSMRPKPAVAGEVDALALAGVFARLYRARRTGRLFINAPDGQEKVIIFRQGVPVNAMSNIADEWLGEVLISHGLIDAEDFQQAVDLRAQQGSRLGSALVHLEKLSPRELHRALSMQAMERLLNVFRLGEGRFRFTADESAAEEEILLLAGPRDIIETGLSAALTGREVTEVLAGYGDPVFSVAVADELAGDLSDADRAVLDILGRGQPLSACLPAIARAARLTTAEARLRVLTLLKFGVLVVGDETLTRLEKTLERLQEKDFFAQLEVRRADSAEAVEAAYQAALEKHGARPQPGDGEAVQRVRSRITTLLDKAKATLTDLDERAIYERALQLGLDFEQAEVRQRLEHEHTMNQGKALLAQQRYDEALHEFSRAAEAMPDAPEVHVQKGWARFLGSARDKNAAATAIAEVERALKLSSERDDAYLTIGKIHRLAGNLTPAEDNLRRAIQLNPHNHEAQSELRLLFSRELGKKGPKLELSLSSGPLWQLAFAVLVCAGLFVGANIIPGGATIWPDAETQAQVKQEGSPMMQRIAELAAIRLNYDEPQLLDAVHRLGAPEKVGTKKEALDWIGQQPDLDVVREALRTERKVAPEEQVLGNVEYFYQPDDTWWWVRRVVLLIAGVLGIFLINREKPGDLSFFGERPSWVMAAIPYGAAVGFLSPELRIATDPGPLLGMTGFHVLAEQVFFFWFLGRGLMKKLDHPVLSIGLTAFLFGAYHATYFSVLSQPAPFVIRDVLQIGAFAGGAYALLLWRSGGIVAPLVAHLLVNGTMMIRTIA